MRFMILSAVLLLPASAPGDFVILDAVEFNKILAADSDRLMPATGFIFTEGPVWSPPGGFLLFSDIDGDRLVRWTSSDGATTFLTPSNKANGNTRDLQGNLITCEHGRRCVSRNGVPLITTHGGAGQLFNSPNDAVVKTDGTIWFTDPDYGLAGRTKYQAGNYVYRFDPATSAVTAVVLNFNQPNGLCFSPDESKLYIADSGTPHHIRVFTVQANNTLTEIGTSFVTISPGGPDGIRCDVDGRLFSSAADGVQVFLSNGTKIGTILVPETSTTNLCFGGADGRTLFMTARDSLYSIHLNTMGAGVAGGAPPPPAAGGGGGGGGCGALGFEVFLILIIARCRTRGATQPAS